MKSRKAQSTVEIALLIPILVFFLCAVVDFGRILYSGITINSVSQECVRYVAIGKSDRDAIALAKTSCSLDDKDSMSISISGSRNHGDYVTVTISYPIKYITPIMRGILGDSYTVKASATMRVE